MSPFSSWDYRNRIDFDAKVLARERGDLDGRAGGAVAAEYSRVDLVHARELGDVDEEHAAAQHVSEAGTARLQDGGDILQRLLRLSFDVGSRKTIRRGVASGLTGDEDQIAGPRGRRIRAGWRGQRAAGDGLHWMRHPAMLCQDARRLKTGSTADVMNWLQACVVVLAGLAPGPAQDPAREAVAIGRSRDAALYAAFHSGYSLAASGEVERAEIITEFRRAVLIVRQHADLGEYSFNENNLAREMGPYRGLVAFVAQVRLNPLHVYGAPPAYEMYVRTGAATKPATLSGFKREPVYPPGFHDKAVTFTAFRLEGSVAREAIENAAQPALVIVNDRGDVIWQARLDLSRFR